MISKWVLTTFSMLCLKSELNYFSWSLLHINHYTKQFGRASIEPKPKLSRSTRSTTIITRHRGKKKWLWVVAVSVIELEEIKQQYLLNERNNYMRVVHEINPQNLEQNESTNLVRILENLTICCVQLFAVLQGKECIDGKKLVVSTVK